MYCLIILFLYLGGGVCELYDGGGPSVAGEVVWPLGDDYRVTNRLDFYYQCQILEKSTK